MDELSIALAHALLSPWQQQEAGNGKCRCEQLASQNFKNAILNTILVIS